MSWDVDDGEVRLRHPGDDAAVANPRSEQEASGFRRAPGIDSPPMTILPDQALAEADEIVRVTLVPEDIRLLLVAADILQKDDATSSE